MRYQMLQHKKDERELDPRRGQGRILAVLKMKHQISQKDLTEMLKIRQQSLGEQLKKLEQAGYITRTPSQTDKRAMIVSLTRKGDAFGFHHIDDSDVFSCLNEEEQENLKEYLSRISSRIECLLHDAGSCGLVPENKNCEPENGFNTP